MTLARLLLVFAALLTQTALAQEGLVRFPAIGMDPHYPYELWIRNESRVPRTVRLEDVRARLAPVTPDLGRISSARVIFAPGTPVAVKLPPYRDADLPPYRNQVVVPFRLETDAPRGVYALELNLPGGFVWDNPPGFDPVIDYPLAHMPGLRVPETYRPGQRFLFLGNAPADYRYEGGRLQNPVAYGRMFTLTAYRADRVSFRVDGLPGEVQLRTASRSRFPNLAPVLDDPHLAGVRRAYQGQRVWAYGGFGVTCPPEPGASIGLNGPPRESLRARHVLRVAWPVGLGLAGFSGLGSYNAASPGDLMTGTPLVVQYEPRDTRKTGATQGGRGRPQPCQLLTQLLADSWQLPTVLSLTPPPKLLRVRNMGGYLGLTRQQHAWLEGYPSATFGTLPRLRKLRRWRYANIPFPIMVTFGQEGRVVAREVPQLP